MRTQSGLGEFAKYVSLSILGMLGLSCYILADTFFISKGLGTAGLAALNLAIPVYSFVHGCGLMLGMGGATRYSIFKGQSADENADKAFSNTLYMAAAAALLFLLLGGFFSGGLTALLGAEAETAAMTSVYLKVILLFSPAFLLNDILICFVRNDGNPRLSMLAMLGGSLANILLDYLFIFPMNMGMFGAVLATGLAPVISISILAAHWIKKQNGFAWKKGKPDLPAMCMSLSVGLPSLVTEVSSGVVIIVINILILKLEGNTGVAAYGVIANLSLVIIAIYTGLAQGMQPIVSRAYGRNDAGEAKRTLRRGLVTMLGVSAIVYLAVFVFAAPLTGVFNSEGNMQLQEIASSGMRLYFTAIPFAGFNIVLCSFFASSERAASAHLISLLRGFLVILPMTFLLSGLAGIAGVWLAFPVTEGAVCVVGSLLFCARRSGREG